MKTGIACLVLGILGIIVSGQKQEVARLAWAFPAAGVALGIIRMAVTRKEGRSVLLALAGFTASGIVLVYLLFLSSGEKNDPSLSYLIALVTLFTAICIPHIIATTQQYTSLAEQYRSPNMGFAIYSIFRFYKKDCNDNPDEIYDRYINRFENEIKIPLANGEKIDPSATLQFQRRLVAYFYWDLAKAYFDCGDLLFRKKLLQMVEGNERKLISLVLQMGEANAECFERCENIAEPMDDDVPMNRLIKRLYDETEGMA